MNIGSIKWPLERKEAIDLYLTFLINSIHLYDINFERFSSNPVDTARSYIENRIGEAEYHNAVEYWWELIDKGNSLRDFDSEDILMARLGVCLTSANVKEVTELANHLSWFIELIDYLNLDPKLCISLMNSHFKF